MTATNSLYRALPSIDVLFKAIETMPGVRTIHSDQAGSADMFELDGIPLPRSIVRELANEYLEVCRTRIQQDAVAGPEEFSLNVLTPKIASYIKDRGRPRFRRVINATGVVIHTNLGRSLLAKEALDAVADACAHYSNLEFNLETGERGSRYNHVEELLCSITGAEAALVVNNNAAAVLLVLDTLCKGREVIVSRGQLVEIGGSFRIPEVMEKSGCILKEVGSTNRVHPHDYANAINSNTAALVKVHTSNYRVVGFHREVSLPDLVELGQKHGLPVFEDLGSGNLCDFAAAGAPLLAQDEPTVQKVVVDGAAVVSFSGDKVLGGPQAGIIVGKKEYLSRIRKNPLNRALRIDKMTLAALEATLRLYREPALAVRRIPTLRMICTDAHELAIKARELMDILQKRLNSLAEITVREGTSLVGGGSFPERRLKTSILLIKAPKTGPQKLRELLLLSSTPVVARIEEDKLCLDLRTIEQTEFTQLADALLEALDKIQP